jgi:hypothetical protein
MSPRREPIEISAPYRGCCSWCGAPRPAARKYCSAECKKLYANRLLADGKAIAELMKVHRLERGRKGTRAEGLLTIIHRRVDEAIANDRERHADCKANKLYGWRELETADQST